MKKAIIIGASSGIGRSLAEVLTSNGYKVGVTGRRTELLDSLRDQHPNKIVAKQMDVQDLSRIPGVIDELIRELGGLDLFVISAGIGEENKALDFAVENEVLKTNVQAFTCLADHAMNFFRKQGHGHLVNISSVAGLRGNRVAPSYNASKAYQIKYLEGLRLLVDRKRMPVHVTDVRPGFVKTDMAKGDGMFWVAPVEKAAGQIYSAIKGRKKVVYVTRRWWLVGMIYKSLPYSLLRRL